MAEKNISIYSTLVMLRMLIKMFPPKEWLLDTFFPVQDPVPNVTMNIDIYKKKRIMAPYVIPRSEGSLMPREGYTSNIISFPYLKPVRELSTN